MKWSKFSLLLLLSIALFCANTRLLAFDSEQYSGTTMGPIEFHVTVVDRPDSVTPDSIKEAIATALNDVNDRMSTYQPDSEVSRFNASESTDWFDVSLSTAAVVQRSQEISEATDGAFDITVGPLVSLWKFGANPNAESLPSPAQVDETLKRIGYKNLEVRLVPPAIKKSIPQISIDLSAIAKGYAVDQVALALNELSLEDYMVEVGGEVRTLGNNPDGKPWSIAIEKPVEGARIQSAVTYLKNHSMATSGDYRTFYVVDGKRYTHEIDPRSGRPVEHNLASVSIVADDCMTADALATACMVMGADQIESLMERENADAFWILREGESFQYESTRGFPLTDMIDGADDAESSSVAWLPLLAATIIVFALALIGMSVGVIFSNREIKGSCGGLAAVKQGDVHSPCEICEARSTCEEYQKKKETVAASSSED